MTASLTNTVALLADTSFRNRIQAAIVEAAVAITEQTTGTFGDTVVPVRLAMAIIADASRYVGVFAPLCADDATISANDTAAAVDDADIRRVIAAKWAAVAISLPNLT